MILMGDEFGRTPARQQQRVLSGQRDRLDEMGWTWRARNGAGGFRTQTRRLPGTPTLLRSGRFMHGQHITKGWPGERGLVQA
jgi:hypothetical protein